MEGQCTRQKHLGMADGERATYGAILTMTLLARFLSHPIMQKECTENMVYLLMWLCQQLMIEYMIDKTIYCGEYREGTATVFRNFRIWKK